MTETLLPSGGTHPPNTCGVRQAESARGYSHSRRALWYRRPRVCLSTCSGHLLMCRRVSLQNSWCLGTGKARSAGTSTTSPEPESRGLRGGPGSKILKNSPNDSTLQRGCRALTQGSCDPPTFPRNAGLASLGRRRGPAKARGRPGRQGAG